MDYKKMRQETIAFAILFFIALTICLIAIYFMGLGVEEDQMAYTIGGAVFTFVSAYSMCVFVGRLLKVWLARKVGDIMLYERIRSVKQIADKLDKTPEKIQALIVFLINNNYISHFKLEGDVIINLTEERLKRARLEEKLDTLKEKVTEIARDYSSVRHKKKMNSARCTGCGATVVFSDTQAICPYCGNLLKSQN